MYFAFRSIYTLNEVSISGKVDCVNPTHFGNLCVRYFLLSVYTKAKRSKTGQKVFHLSFWYSYLLVFQGSQIVYVRVPIYAGGREWKGGGCNYTVKRKCQQCYLL